MNSIFEFTDFRQYLKDYYETHREAEKGFSFRRMSHQLGFTSPNFLKLVIDGKRNISKESLEKLIKGFNFNRKEADYFTVLVNFALAKNPIQKNYYFSLLVSLRAKKNIAPITKTHIEYLNNWYNPVVRELVAGLKDPLDYAKLSSMMFQAVSAVKIRKSVVLLKKLDLLRIDENGKYTQSSALLDTGDDMSSHAVRTYHKNILDIAKISLDTVPVENREFNSLTIRVSEFGFHSIKNKLQDIRKVLLDSVAQDKNTDRIYALCFQLFPIARIQAKDFAEVSMSENY